MQTNIVNCSISEPSDIVIVLDRRYNNTEEFSTCAEQRNFLRDMSEQIFTVGDVRLSFITWECTGPRRYLELMDPQNDNRNQLLDWINNPETFQICDNQFNDDLNVLNNDNLCIDCGVSLDSVFETFDYSPSNRTKKLVLVSLSPCFANDTICNEAQKLVDYGILFQIFNF